MKCKSTLLWYFLPPRFSSRFVISFNDSYIESSRLLYLLDYSKLWESCSWFDEIENNNCFNITSI